MRSRTTIIAGSMTTVSTKAKKVPAAAVTPKLRRGGSTLNSKTRKPRTLVIMHRKIPTPTAMRAAPTIFTDLNSCSISS